MTAAIDWTAIGEQLDRDGYAVMPRILSPTVCKSLARRFDDSKTRFRSTVDMARYNFGQGHYRYFDYPLPRSVETLRRNLYPPLAVIANGWAQRLGEAPHWPPELETLLRQCQAAGQTRPTPLLLRYQTGDYNCLHQDLYGPLYFPLQVIVMLSVPSEEFEGGELILVEQRPRMQSRPMVVSPTQGEAVVMPVRERPRQGARGFHRAQMRHGVSRVRSGTRTTLGLIFHDAR